MLQALKRLSVFRCRFAAGVRPEGAAKYRPGIHPRQMIGMIPALKGRCHISPGRQPWEWWASRRFGSERALH